MCRGKNQCTELDVDISKWDNQSPLRRPDTFQHAIDLFIEAVHCFQNGEKDLAISIINNIDSDTITQWYVEHGQISGRIRAIILNRPKPKSIPTEDRDPERSPRKFQEKVFMRDNYHCRYCGNKVFSQRFLKAFSKKLSAPNFRRGRTNLETHAIFHLGWPVADHVVPWNIGGTTTLDNLVTSCAPCNYGKDGYTAEQIGIENPFNRPANKIIWIGFDDLYSSILS